MRPHPRPRRRHASATRWAPCPPDAGTEWSDPADVPLRGQGCQWGGARHTLLWSRGSTPTRPQRGGQSQWRTTSRWAASPRSGTPSTADPPSGAASASSTTRSSWARRASAPTRRCSTTATSPRRWRSTASGRSATWARRPTTRCCRGTSGRTTSSRARSSRTPTSSPAAGSCSATATCGCRMPCPARRARGTATASATSASTSSAAGPASRPSSGRSRWGRATTSSSPGPPPTGGSPPGRRGPAAHDLHRGEQPHRPAEALPQQVRPAPRAQPLLRARPAPPAGPAARRGRRRGPGRDDRGLHQAPRRRTASSGGIVGTVHVLPFHPLDVVGWDGCLYPYVFNVRDYEPITGRIHQPPPAHQVFEGWNFVVCNFVPRKVDYHPLAIPVPYYHSNVDSDEVMFYVDGDYEARKGSGIAEGSISLHPGGPRARPAAGRRGGLARQALLRRARRHGRHLPSARARRGRAGLRRRGLRRHLEPRPPLTRHGIRRSPSCGSALVGRGAPPRLSLLRVHRARPGGGHRHRW